MNGDLHDEERDMWGEPPEEDAMIDRASLIGAAEGIALRDGTHNLRYIVGALYDEHIARASRPREAGSGAPDEGSKWYTGDGEAFIVLPPNEVRRLRIEAAQSMRAAPVVPITHTVAPEACPGESATAEGGGDVPLFMRACQVLGCGARGVTENAGPWYCALHHPEHPAYATPASAAGREGAVEKVVEAAKALRKAHLRWAEHHEQHDEVCDFGCHAAKQGAEMGFDEALDALLAAEAAARGEKEA